MTSKSVEAKHLVMVLLGLVYELQNEFDWMEFWQQSETAKSSKKIQDS